MVHNGTVPPSTVSQVASNAQNGMLPYNKRLRISGMLPYNTLPQRCKLCHELTAAFMVADRLPVSRKFTAGLIKFLSILSLYCKSRDDSQTAKSTLRQKHVQQDEEHVPHYVVAETLSGIILSSATDCHWSDTKYETNPTVGMFASSLLCGLQRQPLGGEGYKQSSTSIAKLSRESIILSPNRWGSSPSPTSLVC